jgi:hypothetical protein
MCEYLTTGNTCQTTGQPFPAEEKYRKYIVRRIQHVDLVALSSICQE